MGTGEKKCPSYPRESLEMGTGEKSVFHTQRKAGEWVQERKRSKNGDIMKMLYGYVKKEQQIWKM